MIGVTDLKAGITFKEEHFDIPGICLIEWPEKAEGTLPAFDLQIQLTAGADENERSININALSQSGASILKEPSPE